MAQVLDQTTEENEDISNMDDPVFGADPDLAEVGDGGDEVEEEVLSDLEQEFAEELEEDFGT